MHDSLSQVVALVVASAVIAYICHRLRILPIVGFLIAGVVIGPNALALVEDAEFIEFIAEIGVVLLLFTLGIEFSLDRVWRIRRAIFAGGGLQLVLTIAVAMGILALLGIDLRTGFFTGSLIALSSTAIVLKVLNEKNEVTTPKGQLSLGILIFQDLAIVALVLVLPLLGGGGGSMAAIARGLGLAALIVVLVVVVARRVMPLILERVARTCSQEIFLLTIIAICLGTAWLTSLAGVSLSLGAFLAGLVVSESRFSHHAFAEILPLQILFSAVFFVSVGLLLDVAFVLHNPLLVLAVVVAIVIIKVLVTGIAARVLGYSVGIACSTALLLAQVGEFSFVLARVGRQAGLFPAGVAGTGAQTFIAAAVILMAITPLLAKAGRAFEPHVEATPEPEPDAVELTNHVIVAGYGVAARYVTRALRDTRQPFVIVTLSPTGASHAQQEGMEVILGDYARQHLLETVGIGRARMLVIPDDTPEMAARVTAVARELNPRMKIIVRTQAAKDVDELLNEGADTVLVDERAAGEKLVAHVLEREDGMDRTIRLTEEQRTACEHASKMQSEITTGARGCDECLKIGDTWVHLRMCMQCGNVGCCDSSKNKHATKHWHASQHPVIRSFQPREEWAWCYPDEIGF